MLRTRASRRVQLRGLLSLRPRECHCVAVALARSHRAVLELALATEISCRQQVGLSYFSAASLRGSFIVKQNQLCGCAQRARLVVKQEQLAR